MAVWSGSQGKTVVLASADAALRQRLGRSLAAMRWTVCEAAGGAEALAQMDASHAEALVVDHWLPDLEAAEFAGQVSAMYPELDVLRVDGDPVEGATRSPRRHELLHALREAWEDLPLAPVVDVVSQSDGAAWMSAPVTVPAGLNAVLLGEPAIRAMVSSSVVTLEVNAQSETLNPIELPGMVGRSALMHELARQVRLVAPTNATVLIEGETGTGKELVAQAVHTLSKRAGKPFAVLNCAAIPESLLEAELFGHTRGAFTGAVTSRTGRIEAAHGGTLFLDEIGEMPLALQAKMLRFLECGELQRVGENDVVRVDVRVIAATHQMLEKRAAEGSFRLDLYHRLAVFPIDVPALRDRMEELDVLSEFILAKLGESAPKKRLSADAFAVLQQYAWPGNVRELGHALQRATILAGDRPEILPEDIRLSRTRR
ncbi:sigma 54-interacting transcriptional regulator [Granulicella cerasi]|uniref:Sigma 54-interacting transcriptional regulator n=1 Tax=Granulicella cerasi TaxID=741063 RepID=A0ABW1Z4G0_9BACT|nr:sigma-54 dependent transcriptional regulator [Granulicella cerasi]